MAQAPSSPLRSHAISHRPSPSRPLPSSSLSVPPLSPLSPLPISQILLHPLSPYPSDALSLSSQLIPFHFFTFLIPLNLNVIFFISPDMTRHCTGRAIFHTRPDPLAVP